MKFKINWQHLGVFVVALLATGGNVYEHSSIFGNLHPAAPTLTTWITWGVELTAGTWALLQRSPADVWKIAQGELVAIAKDFGVNLDPNMIPGPPNTNTIPPNQVQAVPPPGPPASLASRRGFIRSEALTAIVFCAGVIAILSVANCKTPQTPAKVGTEIALGKQAECVFEKLDSGESVPQTAADCAVSADDVFAIISLFERRARTRNLCTTDGGF